ncbi:hypothetical protein CF139_16535 [Aeromonas hydrophila]|nr:hypothetical protein CF139_16535 [Aeromonas hydrophila]
MEGSVAGGYLPAAAPTQSSVHEVYEVKEGGFWLTMGTQIEGALEHTGCAVAANRIPVIDPFKYKMHIKKRGRRLPSPQVI